jgi:hypothetical protein
VLRAADAALGSQVPQQLFLQHSAGLDATLDEASPGIFSVLVRRLVEFLPEPEKLELIKSLKDPA